MSTVISNSTEGNDSSVTGEDQATLVELANIGLRSWRLFFVLPVLGVVLAVGSGLLTPRTFSVSTSFVPQSAQGSGSDLAGLARQFGVNVAPAPSGQSPDFYAMILMTRELLGGAAETSYTVEDDGQGPESGTLADLYGIEMPDAEKRHRAAIERLRDDISVETDHTTGVVDVTVSALWPSLAEQIAARLLDLVNEFNMKSLQTQASAEATFAKGRMEEAQQDLQRAETALKAFVERNRSFQQSPELSLEHERLQREVSLRQQVYVSLVQLHDQARINAARNLPVITVLERPEGAAVRDSRRLFLRFVLGVFVGVIFALLIAATREFSRRTRLQGGAATQEFLQRRREVLQELRRPPRWLGGRFFRS